MLIDYPHSLLCLDDGKLMQANVKVRISLCKGRHLRRVICRLRSRRWFRFMCPA
jgi:hypothetical protein